MSWMRAAREPEFAAYLLATAIALVPIWTTSVFPSQDGGSHVYNAHVLASLLSNRPAAHYADLYTLNLAALANWADHLLLAALTLAVSPARADQLLVSGYVVAFAAAARYAAHSIRTGNAWVAHLALPLVFTFSVHMGFYNFILSFPLYFVLIGYYWRHRDGHHVRALALLLLALYVLHPLSWLFGVLSLTTIIVANARNPHVHGHTSSATTTKRLRQVWLAAAPGAVLLLVLVGQEPVDAAEWQSLPALLRHLYFGGPLWTFGPVDTALGAALFALFVLVSIAAWRSRTAGDAHGALAWATAAYVALLLVLPSQWKSLGLVTERVGTFAFMTWVLTLAGQTYGRRVRIVTIVAAQALTLLLIGRWTVAIVSLDGYVQEYLSVASHVEPSRRILTLNFATRGRGADGQRLVHPVAPFSHTLGIVAAQRDAVIVNDYEALTAVFPLRYRVDAAADALRGTLHDPPDFRMSDLEQFERATCRPIDYVVLWQPNPEDTHTQTLRRSLADRYERTYVSQPGGHAQVLTRRGDVPCG